MTVIEAELQAKAMVELIERTRISRLVMVASASFTALIAIIASLLAIAA